MKSIHVNDKQIARNIAVILKHNPHKIDQLKKVREISEHLTSDDGISIDIEYYGGGLVRYLITGTRCGMTVTAKEPEHKIVRKPRGAGVVFVSWANIHAHDILWMLEDMGVKVYED